MNNHSDEDNERFMAEQEAKYEARDIIRTFIKTENEAEEIKSKVLKKKPVIVGKTNPTQQMRFKDEEDDEFLNSQEAIENDMNIALQ